MMTPTTAKTEPGGRQRRQISATAEPQRRPNRRRTERTKIPTVLALTKRARLAALSVRAKTAEAAVSSSSAAPSHTDERHYTKVTRTIGSPRRGDPDLNAVGAPLTW